ncbi:hypothetical protein F3Y22_tig00110393pilonHSYRG00171 [Hibiscus syriacus]|uniref:Bidirectional sugar transporter SWEET n=1 Tax=Hibiscus syriacus TaxID=106335 RepID=A0A6A3AR96_HIBSY|nr:hypothetical protein F3Y22_tig00110393pilonHSYRG00171 [Hibiscus syriacus]
MVACDFCVFSTSNFLVFSPANASGNIISVFFFLSPLSTFCRIARNRSTEEFESFPYISTLLNSTLWTYYGVTNPGSFLVATIYGFGVVVELIQWRRMQSILWAKTGILFGLLDMGFVAATVLVTQVVVHGDQMRIDVIGFLCAGLNIYHTAVTSEIERREKKVRNSWRRREAPAKVTCKRTWLNTEICTCLASPTRGDVDGVLKPTSVDGLGAVDRLFRSTGVDVLKATELGDATADIF